MPTYAVPTACPSCSSGSGDTRRGQRPVHAEQLPYAGRHLLGAVGGDHPLGGDPEDVALDLAGIADHCAGERRGRARGAAQPGGQLPAGQRLGAADVLAALQQGQVQVGSRRFRGLRAHGPTSSVPPRKRCSGGALACLHGIADRGLRRHRRRPHRGTDRHQRFTGLALPAAVRLPRLLRRAAGRRRQRPLAASDPPASTPPSDAMSTTPRSSRRRTGRTPARSGSPT